MISTFVGVIFILLGFWGVMIWFHDFMIVIRGFGALSLVLGGILAIVFGVSSMTPQRTDDKKEK